jgi:hypothetical protein
MLLQVEKIGDFAEIEKDSCCFFLYSSSFPKPPKKLLHPKSKNPEKQNPKPLATPTKQ